VKYCSVRFYRLIPLNYAETPECHILSGNSNILRFIYTGTEFYKERISYNVLFKIINYQFNLVRFFCSFILLLFDKLKKRKVMLQINRFKISEISIKRIYSAFLRRFIAAPYKLKWSLSDVGITYRKKLKKFKNIHEGKRCYLIANGPSLIKTDINKLANEITFGMNRIYLNYPNMQFKPNYLVCVNNLVLSQFASEFQKENMPVFINWQSREFFKNKSNLYFIGSKIMNTKFSTDISMTINPGATVTYAALQIIYYMGFKEVVIIGMDHNFIYTGKPNEEQIRTEEKDQNHFAPNYFPKGFKWDTPDLISTEYYYKIAKLQYEKAGKRIIDATIGGKCSVFDKADYNTLF
jgi:hypothetical protein